LYHSVFKLAQSFKVADLAGPILAELRKHYPVTFEEWKSAPKMLDPPNPIYMLRLASSYGLHRLAVFAHVQLAASSIETILEGFTPPHEDCTLKLTESHWETVRNARDRLRTIMLETFELVLIKNFVEAQQDSGCPHPIFCCDALYTVAAEVAVWFMQHPDMLGHVVYPFLFFRDECRRVPMCLGCLQRLDAITDERQRWLWAKLPEIFCFEHLFDGSSFDEQETPTFFEEQETATFVEEHANEEDDDELPLSAFVDATTRTFGPL